ncbi:MAG: hypothetical protein K6E16_01150 [Lachnospiraceae bacterium]|nr:hypothetical protein [Lachnospiraceae bacterium]
MKRFLTLKIWIGLEIVAGITLAVFVLLKSFVWAEEEKAPTYMIPASAPEEIDVSDIALPRDLMAEEYDDKTAAADGDLSAETDTVVDPYAMDYPAEVTDYLAKLSSAQKAELLLLTTPQQFCDKGKVTVAGKVFAQAFAQRSLSGMFFSDSNFVTPASGMEMLKTLRGWSRDASGMSLLLGYDKEGQEAGELSDRGFNLLCADVSADPASLMQQAVDLSMVPAIITTFDQIPETDGTIAVIVKTEDPAAIIEAVNAGSTYLYRTDTTYGRVSEGLVAAAESGEIVPEALDKAAGYTLALRYALTQMRPEEAEKEPPKAVAAPAAPAKKKTKQLTPEEQAAALQKQLLEQAAAAAAAAGGGN